MTDLSVIIPLAPDESAWLGLLEELRQLPAATQIIFVTSQEAEPLSLGRLEVPQKAVETLSSRPGRAEQMNAGARVATGRYLWFLHADSKFSPASIPALLDSIKKSTDDLLYFDLIFLNDASALMCLNRWGVKFRSRVLQVPFGDQGFCIRQDLFHQLGGFPEGLPYGEDHVFVWRVRQHGLKLKPVGAALYTSARKYRIKGWLRTTLLHQYLWIKQAWPEWRKLKKGARS
jgi:rSAM/selenodomain-associated transferase 2